MDKITISEHKHLTTKDLLIEMIKYQSPIDFLTEEYPEDIENWVLIWEFNDFVSKKTYQYREKFVKLDGLDFIVNGYLQIHETNN